MNVMRRPCRAAALLWALLGGALFLLHPAGQPAAAGQASKDVYVAIKPFTQTVGADRTGKLSQRLGAAFAVALYAQDDVAVLDAAALRTMMAEKGIAVGADADSPFAAELLRKIGVGYLLEGSFLEFKGNFLFQITLENLNRGAPLKIDPQEARKDQILSAVSRLADQILRRIEEDRSAPKPIRKAAVACFRSGGEASRKETDFYREDISFSIFSALSRISGLSLADPKTMADACARQFDLPAALQRTGADIVVGGDFEKRRNRLKIAPSLQLLGQPEPIALPPIEGNAENYLQLKIQLQSTVVQAVEGIVQNPAGVSELMKMPRLNGSQLVQRALGFFERDELAYIASLYLEQAAAVDRTAADPLYHLGRLRIRYRPALDQFTLDIYYNPSPEGYFWQAMAYQSVAGSESAPYLYELAIRNYQNALAAGDDTPAVSKVKMYALFNMAETYLLMHQYDKALQTVQESAAFSGSYPEEYTAVAQLLSFVAKEFKGVDPKAEQEYFDAVRPGALDLSTFWKFSPVRDLVRSHPTLAEARRERILALIQKLSAPRQKTLQ